jgi:hypothetical protein
MWFGVVAFLVEGGELNGWLGNNQKRRETGGENRGEWAAERKKEKSLAERAVNQEHMCRFD